MEALTPKAGRSALLPLPMTLKPPKSRPGWQLWGQWREHTCPLSSDTPAPKELWNLSSKKATLHPDLSVEGDGHVARVRARGVQGVGCGQHTARVNPARALALKQRLRLHCSCWAETLECRGLWVQAELAFWFMPLLNQQVGQEAKSARTQHSGKS